VINITNLHKNFGDLEVLKNISTEIKKGEIISIIGPSGSGKSTFLRCINKLEEPSSGHIYIDGMDLMDKNTDINKVRERVGMVFQHFNLFPNMTVLDNLTLSPIMVKKESKEEAEKYALSLLEKVGLSDKANSYPTQLSGGQKQRIAIARALAMKPEVILFDEPTSALDPEMIKEVLDVMRDLAKEGMTMLIVTHEMGFARNVGNRILFMDKGEIIEDCSPKEFFENPTNERIKDFLNKVLNK
jgi:amino acid transport ATP-binding protein